MTVSRERWNTKRIILVRRSDVGKITLTQAVEGRRIIYHETQYISNYDVIINTPEEYTENKTLARVLVLYSYETDVMGLLMSAIEDYSLYGPRIVSVATREVAGIITRVDQPDTRPGLAAMWLELTGCKKIFYVSSATGEGMGDILDYLREEGDVIPWKREEKTDETSVNAGEWLHGGLWSDGSVPDPISG